MTSWQNPAARFRYSAEGVRRVPDQSFNDLLTEQLHGELPGNLGRLQPSANLRKSWMDNEFHRRAKDNFRYWLTERPAPTQCELQHPTHPPHPQPHPHHTQCELQHPPYTPHPHPTQCEFQHPTPHPHLTQCELQHSKHPPHPHPIQWESQHPPPHPVSSHQTMFSQGPKDEFVLNARQ